MEKAFNRSTVKEISQKIQEIISKYFTDENYDLAIKGARFSDDLASLNLEVRIKDFNGAIAASEYSHSIADYAASTASLELVGHLIGSSWNVRGTAYTVVGYNTKRPKYPVSLRSENGKSSKASIAYLKQGYQLVAPTLQEFIKWFTLDPDSDAIRESDVEICDKVQEYLEKCYPVEEADKFFDMVDKFNSLGIAKKWAKRGYELLFKESLSIESAYLGLKVIYKEAVNSKKAAK